MREVADDGGPDGHNFVFEYEEGQMHRHYRYVSGTGNGRKVWKHRIGGPSENYRNGELGWCEMDKYHRIDGPAVSKPDGYECWCKNDMLHREGGPAITYPNGTKYWFFEGKLHRTDGPAIEFPNGVVEWWQEGRYVYTPGGLAYKDAETVDGKVQETA